MPSLTYIKIGTGIGCGILIDGRIYHGVQGTAGVLPYRESSISKQDYAAAGIVLNVPIYTGGLFSARQRDVYHHVAELVGHRGERLGGDGCRVVAGAVLTDQPDRFQRGLAAHPARGCGVEVAGDVDGRCRNAGGQGHVEHVVGVGAVFGGAAAVGDPGDVVAAGDHALGEQKPLGQFDIRAWRPHGDGEGSAVDPDLEWFLLRRPVENVMNEGFPWHVWYPLRRTGAFAKLEPIDQSHILREHAALGIAYGQTDAAHDVRLACHGLDAEDNEFLIGLIGKELHPLSHLVQAMRKTRQTSEFIAKMGPFFVGRVFGRSSAK